jgi:hypothetical protein
MKRIFLTFPPDCSPPFEVSFFTNALGDKQTMAAMAIANDAFSRGKNNGTANL